MAENHVSFQKEDNQVLWYVTETKKYISAYENWEESCGIFRLKQPNRRKQHGMKEAGEQTTNAHHLSNRWVKFVVGVIWWE